MGQLENQVVLVTGGGSGLGAPIIRRFIREGAKIGLIERDRAAIKLLSDEFGDAICCVEGDVRSLADNQKAVAATVERFGKLDSFVATAAIVDYGTSVAAIMPDQLEAAFDEVIGVNTKGYLFGAYAAIPELRKTRGNMILTLSTSAFYPGGSGPLYTISKHANVGLVRQLAYELAPDIRVNAVVPGGIKSSSIRGPSAMGQEERSLADAPAEIREKTVTEMSLIARMPEDGEYPPIYVLLASREGSLATGSIIFWDGGIGLVGHDSRRGHTPS